MSSAYSLRNHLSEGSGLRLVLVQGFYRTSVEHLFLLQVIMFLELLYENILLLVGFLVFIWKGWETWYIPSLKE